MSKTGKTFNAKILLFGEYTVILGSKALTIPFTGFSGHLSFLRNVKSVNHDKAQQSNQQLFDYLNYLKSHKHSLNYEIGFNPEGMERDLNNGLFFESDIPQGYGAGSSGALVAALYTRYAGNLIKETDHLSILKLRDIFSGMESFFHGHSSGLDPLSCYLSKPLLVNSSDEIQTVNIPFADNHSKGALFLVDTGYPGQTEPMVNLFLSKVNNHSYRDSITKLVIPLTNRCIDEIVKGDLKNFYDSLRELSKLQLDYFREMIPENFIEIWKHGLDSGEFTLKLCGSGGGGFLTGFTHDYGRMESFMKSIGTKIISVCRIPDSFFSIN